MIDSIDQSHKTAQPDARSPPLPLPLKVVLDGFNSLHMDDVPLDTGPVAALEKPSRPSNAPLIRKTGQFAARQRLNDDDDDGSLHCR